MDSVVALRSIRFDLLDYIQKKVAVDFSHGLQRPVRFTRGRRCYHVTETLGCYRTRHDRCPGGYLVQTDNGQVFFLYFDRIEDDCTARGCAGSWVLSFRILDDRELMALGGGPRKLDSVLS
jgi:hypothetical protein